ncbi:MAG: 4-hydroxy-tetrahydrodipicolinate reductase [Bacteroidales bacterium]|nr:4-hydroxy-tetrahydrodipicolinate reductase [Bacteroidales bacterium]
MKIAIIGYGRMGHIVEEIAVERGHDIVCVIDRTDSNGAGLGSEAEEERLAEMFSSNAFKSADVAIEFSQPHAAVGNILRSFAAGVPVVCGTTGWLDSMPQIRKMCDEGEGTLFYASNFSIGVNVFNAVSKRLAEIMNRFPGYTPSLEEVHHIHKLDHPSGTAITVAEGIIENLDRVSEWKETENLGITEEGVLGISHRREGEVPGIHTVVWDSSEDSITLSHSAKSRRGFALGAVVAAEWLKGRKGFFSMNDMLGF